MGSNTVKPITFKTASGKAYHLDVGKLNPNILSGGSSGRIRKIAKYLKNSEIEEGDRGYTVVHGEYEGIKVSAFSTGMGPASTAIILPEVMELVEGPATLLRLGTAGALQPFMNVGDLAITTASVRDEGTTRAAVGPEYPAIADPELIPLMVAASEKHGYQLRKNLWLGIGHVKDDLYFVETPQFSPLTESMTPKLESYKRMGVISSSMEFSVYCIMRDFYEGRREDRILVGEILSILAAPEKEGAIDVSQVDKPKLEKDMIGIGLDTLVLVDKLRKGKKVDVDRVGTLAKMIQAPSRHKLSKH